MECSLEFLIVDLQFGLYLKSFTNKFLSITDNYQGFDLLLNVMFCLWLIYR